MRCIENSSLTLADVPLADADDRAIAEFAHTFDGYAYWGSFERCAEVANSGRCETLTELRTHLFFQLRAERHCGDEPDAGELTYRRMLIERMKSKVAARELE